MNLVWTLFWFIVAVGLLVTVHEFGHYFVARRLGFKVLRFSVGFGKPLLKWVGGADQVEYVVAAIPLGGYVKLLDEREGPVAPEELARSFTRRPPWQRIAVLLAGPAFNILFAVLVLAGMFWVNGIDEMRPRIGDVTVDSIAARSGLRSGDEIQSVDGRAVAGWRDVVLGLLDAVSSRDEIVLGVRDAAGATRTLHLGLPDAEQRRHLTEPAELLRGLGFEFWQPPIAPIVGPVERGGPAAQAGLVPGDRIVAIDGVRMSDFQEIADYVHARPDQRISLEYVRAGVTHTVALQIAGADVNGKRTGFIHVSPQPHLRSCADRAHPLHAARGARARRHRVLEPHGVPGPPVLAHGDGQGVAEEPQRAVVDCQVRRRVCRGRHQFLPGDPRDPVIVAWVS